MSTKGSLLLLVMTIAGCASISGRPVGLSTCEDPGSCQKYKKDTLAAARNLEEVLKVAESLSSAYIRARDDNLRYAFWSNALYFPLGIAAAAYTAQKNHPNALLNLGIASGALVTANTFINARPNAKVYQAGVTGSVCLTTQLQPFVLDKLKQEGQLESSITTLAVLVADANEVLKEIDELLNHSLIAGPAKAEQNANPTILRTLLTTRQTLAAAAADAQKAIDAANVEVGKFNNVSSYAKNKIVLIDKYVETKIAQSDISYASLTKALTPASASPSATTGQGVKAAGLINKVASAPMQSLVTAAQDTVVQLVDKTKDLIRKTSDFGISAAEKAVDDCVASLTTSAAAQ